MCVPSDEVRYEVREEIHRGLGLLRLAALLVPDHGREGGVALAQPDLLLVRVLQLPGQDLCAPSQQGVTAGYSQP